MFNQFSSRQLIYSSAFLRSLAIGMIAVLLAIFLMKIGFSKTEVGIVVSVGLIGAGLGNLFVSFFGDRLGRRKTLVIYSLLSGAGALALCFSSSFYVVLAAAFFGMINARGKDRGAALVIETAILPSLETDQNRTRAFAFYALVQDLGLAVGAVAAGLPTLFSSFLGIEQLAAFQITLVVYSCIMLLSAILYCYLPVTTEVPLDKIKFEFSPEGRKMVTKLSSLFALDSLAGGFLTSTLISFYFYERFNVGVETIGIIFFIARGLNAVSYFGAVWLSKKIGLINAMVFTHSPSHLFLIAIALAPNFPIAVCFFLLREALVEMDVPTRQSFVMAVIKPEERVKASGIFQMVRMMGWAAAPVFAGYVMQEFSLGSPLYIGAGIKLSYDALVFISLRRLKAPEEPVIVEEQSSETLTLSGNLVAEAKA